MPSGPFFVAWHGWPPAAGGASTRIELYVADMTPEERQIVQAGCLDNYNRSRH